MTLAFTPRDPRLPGADAAAVDAAIEALHEATLRYEQGEYFEKQAYRASGLNLVVAAIILWNTRYLQLAAADLGVEPEIMRHVAPLGWEHLSLTGVYTWDGEDRPAKGAMRPLRTKPSLLAA